MKSSTKIILGVVAIGLFLCCVAGLGFTLLGTRLMGKAVITNPERMAAVSADIADYDIPGGSTRIFASDVSGFKLVALGPETGNNQIFMIMMMQFPMPMAANRGEIERQMRQAMAQQTGMGSATFTVTETTRVFIKGEPVEMEVREGTTQDGIRLRQVTGIFDGKQGPVLLMVLGEVDGWDQDMVDLFLASIR